MEYFLTGGTGFLGGYVAEQLVEAGHDVVALARTPETATDLEAMGTEVVEGDILDPETLRGPMAGADGVFHVAGWYRLGVDDPTPGERINVEGTRNVMEVADDLDVPKIVYTSTLAVNSDTGGQVVDESYRYHGPHLTSYDRTKWEAHHEVVAPMAADGLPVVTVLPGVIYGPGDTSQASGLWADWLAGDLPAIPRETAYCWGHVADTARAHLLAMEHGDPGEEYIVAGEPYTLVEAFDVGAEVLGRDPPRAVSPRWFRGLAALAGVLNRVVDLPVDYHPEALRLVAGVTYLGDNGKAERELGLEHRPLEEGFEEYLAWHRERVDAA